MATACFISGEIYNGTNWGFSNGSDLAPESSIRASDTAGEVPGAEVHTRLYQEQQASFRFNTNLSCNTPWFHVIRPLCWRYSWNCKNVFGRCQVCLGRTSSRKLMSRSRNVRPPYRNAWCLFQWKPMRRRVKLRIFAAAMCSPLFPFGIESFDPCHLIWAWVIKPALNHPTWSTVQGWSELADLQPKWGFHQKSAIMKNKSSELLEYIAARPLGYG